MLGSQSKEGAVNKPCDDCGRRGVQMVYGPDNKFRCVECHKEALGLRLDNTPSHGTGWGTSHGTATYVAR